MEEFASEKLVGREIVFRVFETYGINKKETYMEGTEQLRRKARDREEGRGGELNFDEVIKAQFAIGWMTWGIVLPKDEERAMIYFSKVHQPEEITNRVICCPCAQFYMGWIGYRKEDYVSALVWYENAAELNFAPALCNLGKMYLEGKGMSGSNYKRALACFSKAAKQDSLMAMYYLGWVHEEGVGVAQEDAKKAYELYLKAVARLRNK